ncbi:uncharacterized [Tachysurus ichikawai]
MIQLCLHDILTELITITHFTRSKNRRPIRSQISKWESEEENEEDGGGWRGMEEDGGGWRGMRKERKGFYCLCQQVE